MGWWVASILLVTCLAIVGHVVIRPILTVRSALARRKAGARFQDIVLDLGGGRETVRMVALYLKAPNAVADDKNTAVTLLSFCGQDAVPVLIRLLAGSDRDVVCSAILSVGVMAGAGTTVSAALPGLVQCVDSAWPEVRAEAAYTLGTLGRQDRWVRDALRRAVGDSDVATAVMSARALREMGEGDGEIVAALCRGLSAPDPLLRHRAIETLGWCPGLVDEATATLMIGCLGDPCQEVRTSAAIAVEGIAAQFPDAVGAAYGGAQNDLHRCLLIHILRACREQGVLYLCKALGDTDSALARRAAARALGEMGRCASEALPALRNCLADTNRLVREAAQAAIAGIEAGQQECPETQQAPWAGASGDGD